MNANPIWRTLETFEKVLSTTPKNEKLYIVHEDGMNHLEKDCREVEEKMEKLLERNDRLAEYNEILIDEAMQLKAEIKRLNQLLSGC